MIPPSQSRKLSRDALLRGPASRQFQLRKALEDLRICWKVFRLEARVPRQRVRAKIYKDYMQFLGLLIGKKVECR